MEKDKSDRVIECIDNGLLEAERVTVEDGIVAAILAGRMTEAEGKECLEAYERVFLPDDAA